jgi:hypothetical protein
MDGWMDGWMHLDADVFQLNVDASGVVPQLSG